MASSSRKKVDNRIRVLIENGIALRHRTMFVVVGDKAKDQVPVHSAQHVPNYRHDMMRQRNGQADGRMNIRTGGRSHTLKTD